MTQVANGLEGIAVAETTLSEIDGQRGTLRIKGFALDQLVARAGFEQTCSLLLDGELPSAERAEVWQQALGQARVQAFEQLSRLGDALQSDDAMDALRASVAHIRPPADSGMAPATLVGAVGVFAPAWARLQQGLAPHPPDPSAHHAADMLAMLHGQAQPAAAGAALETYLTTVADHGMNASTFAARVVASTGSDVVSAMVAALGALKGPLHGGAPGPVLDMLDAIGQPERARTWLQGELAAGKRIMGMGHRVYRTRDPRARVLAGAVRQLQAAGLGSRERLALAEWVEQEAERLLAERRPDRPLRANVEFYTAVLLETLGVPRALFTGVFAAGRAVGWAAHVAEQRRTGRLIRPASVYVGPRYDGS